LIECHSFFENTILDRSCSVLFERIPGVGWPLPPSPRFADQIIRPCLQSLSRIAKIVAEALHVLRKTGYTEKHLFHGAVIGLEIAVDSKVDIQENSLVQCLNNPPQTTASFSQCSVTTSAN
jgi:hypothetical protein